MTSVDGFEKASQGVPCAVLDEEEGDFFVYPVIKDGNDIGW